MKCFSQPKTKLLPAESHNAILFCLLQKKRPKIPELSAALLKIASLVLFVVLACFPVEN